MLDGHDERNGHFVGLYNISLSIHSRCFLCDIFFFIMTKFNKMTKDILFCVLLKKKYMYINIKINMFIYNFVIVIVRYKV